jgi:GNAT superfamily N-acetyltransferase
MAKQNELTIRTTTKKDIPLILQLIKELADYEQLSHEVVATHEVLTDSLFNKHQAEAFIAEVDQQPIGFAIVYHSFSSFLGKAGLYLEDIYIRPNHRHIGYGHQMLEYLAKLAVTRGYERIEWSVLNWNEPSIAFYKKIGATPLSEWTVYRLHKKQLINLAKLSD